MSYIKQYYEKNKEKLNKRSKEYYEKNKEKMLAYTRQYYQNRQEEIKNNKKLEYYNTTYSKQYYEKNKEEIKQKQLEYYNKNKEKIQEYNRQYWKTNRDSLYFMRSQDEEYLNYQKQYRARKKTVKVETNAVYDIYLKQDNPLYFDKNNMVIKCYLD